MSFNVAVGQITQPGSTGNQTISLASNFDPKAIIAWTVPLTAAGTSAAAGPNGFAFGAATYRSSTIAEWWVASGMNVNDPSASGGAHACGKDALLKLLTNDTSTPDFAMELVSMSTGGTSNVVVNFSNLHTTASILINYLILGGSDITDATCVVRDGGGGADEDFTLSGFGQPDLVMFGNAYLALGAGTSASSTNDTTPSIGWGNKQLQQAVLTLKDVDAADMILGRYQRADRILAQLTTAFAIDYEYALASVGSWPTDGVRISRQGANGTTHMIGCLMLKGTFSSAIGVTNSPTAAAPQNLDIPISFTPAGAVFHSSAIPGGTTVDTSHGDLGQFDIGATDGTNNLHAGYVDDDTAALMRVREFLSTTKALEQRSQNAGTNQLRTDASATLTPGNVRLVFSTTNSTARELIYVAFGQLILTPATSAGAATASATVVRDRARAASSAGAATVSVPLFRVRARVTSSSGSASVSCALGRVKTITAASSGTSSVSAVSVFDKILTPTAHGVATVTSEQPFTPVIPIPVGGGGFSRFRPSPLPPLREPVPPPAKRRTRILSAVSRGTSAVHVQVDAVPLYTPEQLDELYHNLEELLMLDLLPA